MTAICDEFSVSPPRELVERCDRRFLPRGTTLYSQGEEHETNYLLRSGLVRAFYLSPDGKEYTLSYWSTGDLVGGPDFFGRIPHVWSVQTVNDTVAYAIDGRRLRELVGSEPHVAEFVIDDLMFKARWLSAAIQIHATESATERLAHMLVKLAELHGESTETGVVLKYYFSQEQLANMVGASRQWICMTLNRLERSGLVRVSNRRIELLNIAALKEGGHTSQAEHALSG